MTADEKDLKAVEKIHFRSCNTFSIYLRLREFKELTVRNWRGFFRLHTGCGVIHLQKTRRKEIISHFLYFSECYPIDLNSSKEPKVPLFFHNFFTYLNLPSFYNCCVQLLSGLVCVRAVGESHEAEALEEARMQGENKARFRDEELETFKERHMLQR